MSNPIDEFLLKQAELLTGDINSKITPSSPWLSQFPKNAWPDEVGFVIRNAVWERSFPLTENAWEDVISDGSNNICLPTPDKAAFAQTVRSSNLATKAIISPDFCIDDLKVRWKRKRQLGLVVEGLAEIVKNYNIKRYRNAYMASCGQRVICAAGLPSTGETDIIASDPPAAKPNLFVKGDAKFPATVPTSIATHGILDHFHSFLDREGATRYASGQTGGGYIYKLITSAEHSRWLRKDDNLVREDIRNSSQSDILLKGLGIAQTYNGYAHLIDPLPRRWKWTDPTQDTDLAPSNGWHEVFPWYPLSTDPSHVDYNKWVQNPEYAVAPYEDAVIFVPSVMECLVPIPVDSVGRAKFAAQNYQGDYKWLNIAHKTDNPLQNIGNFYGRITNGFQVHHPEYGIVLRHQRAPLELDLKDVNP